MRVEAAAAPFGEPRPRGRRLPLLRPPRDDLCRLPRRPPHLRRLHLSLPVHRPLS